MDFFEVIQRRRSIRRYSDDNLPDEWIERALEAAHLAPTSSNMQAWDFYWTKRGGKTHDQLVKACLSQGAAKTASHLIVVTADFSRWRRSTPQILQFIDEAFQKVAPEKPNFPRNMRDYYARLIPLMYRQGFGSFGIIRWLTLNGLGLFRPMTRGPIGRRDIQEVVVKSAALACENLVLALTAQGGDTCMMEGFDEVRVQRALKIARRERVVMVISAGYGVERGRWGERFRIPLDQVVHRIRD